MPDRSGRGKHLGVEVNWNDAVRPAETIRFFDKAGNTFYVDRKELLSILFMFGNEEEQMQLINPSLSEVVMKRYEIKFNATQPYNKGDEIIANVEIPVKIADIRPQVKHSDSGLHRP